MSEAERERLMKRAVVEGLDNSCRLKTSRIRSSSFAAM